MAGGSAQDRYEQFRRARLERLRANRTPLIGLALLAATVGAVVMHRLIGAWWLGAILGLLPVVNMILPQQRELAWRKGAEGERVVGLALDALGPTSIALHDLLVPGSRANIDHIVVGPSGVWTVDAKHYRGRLETRRRDAELWVGGRNRSKLLDQADQQRAVVHRCLVAAGLGSVPVRPALCFVGAEWPLLRPSSARGVALLSPRRLGPLRATDGPMPPHVVRQVADVLRGRLQPASPRSGPGTGTASGRST
jgi:hypothetical protein